MKQFILLLIALITLTSCESDHIQVLADDGELVNVYDHKQYRDISQDVVIMTTTSIRTGVSHYIDRVYVGDSLPESKSVKMSDSRGDYTVYYKFRKGVIVEH